MFADSDTHIANDTGVHVIRMAEHYGALSPGLPVASISADSRASDHMGLRQAA